MNLSDDAKVNMRCVGTSFVFTSGRFYRSINESWVDCASVRHVVKDIDGRGDIPTTKWFLSSDRGNNPEEQREQVMRLRKELEWICPRSIRSPRAVVPRWWLSVADRSALLQHDLLAVVTPTRSLEYVRHPVRQPREHPDHALWLLHTSTCHRVRRMFIYQRDLDRRIHDLSAVVNSLVEQLTGCWSIELYTHHEETEPCLLRDRIHDVDVVVTSHGFQLIGTCFFPRNL